MSRFHGPKESTLESERHLNYMAGGSYDIKDPVKQLRIIASSCFFGEPKYYQLDEDDKRPVRAWGMPQATISAAQVKHLRECLDAIDPQEWRKHTPSEAIEFAIDKALDHNAEATLQEAVRLRQEEHMRTTPQVILVRAAHHPKVRGTGLVRRYAGRIIQRPDEPAVCLAYHLWRYKGKPIPNALKKAWADKLSRTSEDALAKYRLEKKSVKTVDVVNLCHAKSEAINKLMKGELSNTEKTWEAIISSEGSKKESWEKAIEVMGHMALLRNLRNFLDAGVDPAKFLTKLVEGARTGQQLPFRYISAYNSVKGRDPRVMDAVEECLKQSLGNLPFFPGRTMSLCDNSGSARGAATSSMGTMKVCDIANLTAIITGMVSGEGYVGVFGDRLEVMPVRKQSSVFDQLKEVDELGERIGGSTENGIWLFWDKAIREKQHWDNVFVYSDMQAGHGGLFGINARAYRDYLWAGSPQHIDTAKLVNKYRSTVNPNVNVFLVQVAGYQDTILPEFYRRTYILGGWGEGILRFAAEMSGLVGPKQ